VKRSAAVLSGAKFPVSTISYTSEDGRLPRDEVETLIRWVDLLDRI